jgi:hypothetical protein
MNSPLKEPKNSDLTLSTMTRKFCILKHISLFCVCSLLLSCHRIGKEDRIKEGFIAPPDSSKPGVYWYFMDGNMDRLAITADLESMKKAGLGYALFLEVNVGIPRGKVDFLSDEWLQLFEHAVRESERLGIRIIMGSGPGWTGSGGPWVKPEQSMMHLVGSDTMVTGPYIFDAVLPLPVSKAPFFGEESLTPALKEQRDKWYEDVAVLAFPAPAANRRMDGIDEKALYYRAPYTSQPGVEPFIPALADYNETPGAQIKKDQVIDLTSRLQDDGRIQWSVPPGKWIILRLVERNNGAVTRPAPVPGLGFESDKFDTASFDAHYRAYTGRLINKVMPVKSPTGGGWTMIHMDSWEMGAQNWSPGFIEDFIERRGYDPLLYLPVYKGFIINSTETSERFLWDIRETSNELIIENNAERFKELGKKNGFRLSIEPYDMNPSADLDLGSVADVPMGEFWSESFGFNSAFSCIEATSIAHVTGKPVVAAEAFTADQREAWKKYPADMKNQTDWALSLGINRFIFHTFVHKSTGDKLLPGITMGPYGVHWDRGQTWWNMVQEYHNYLSRCQFVLSQGTPKADILYLAAEGAPNVFRPPSSSMEGSDTLPDKRGYSFDGCSPRYFIANAAVKDSRIIFPGGSSYSLVVLPDVKTMTPELLTKLEQLIREGAVMTGNPPLKSPSLTNFPECDNRVKTITKILWRKTDIPEGIVLSRYVKGSIYMGNKLTSLSGKQVGENSKFDLYPDYEVTAGILKSMGINPDFKSSGNIRFNHRSLPDREIYFISNRSAFHVEDSCVFRDGSMDAELWNPVNGEIRSLNNLTTVNGGTSLKVNLDGYESCFIVFYHTKKTAVVKNSGTINFPVKNPVMQIKGPWNVSFDPAWGGPKNITLDTLQDWSKRTEEGIKYYSGKAVYTIDFDFSGIPLNREKTKYYLDLGKVRNIARVRLNDKDLGIVWTSPWQVNISDELKKKSNHLEIEVANLWINRLIGDESKPWDGIDDGRWPDWLLNGTQRVSGRFTFTTHRFYQAGDPLVESGLIGPVRILTALQYEPVR